MKTMFLTTLRLGIVVLLAVSMIGTFGGLLAYHAVGGEPAANEEGQPNAAESVKNRWEVARQPAKDGAQKDLERLQAVWKVLSYELAGTPQDGSDDKPKQLVFGKDKVVFMGNPADVKALTTLEAKVRQVAKAVAPAVVAVKNPTDAALPRPRRHEAGASGVIITQDGLVLTQHHVSHQKAGKPQDKDASFQPGDKTKIILHDGRECEAELLGANQTHDLALLRLVPQGPYPYVPLKPDVRVQVGDWVLNVGHPAGYRRDRPAPVRLGRVLALTNDVFGIDSAVTGGDSGGPVFDLDGNLAGVLRRGDVFRDALLPADDALAQRCHAWEASASSLIHVHLNKMQRRELTPNEIAAQARIDDELVKQGRGKNPPLLALWMNGPPTLAAWRPLVDSVRRSTVVVLDENAPVALGTVVGSDGWIVTKASELPAKPKCRLADGTILAARVVGVDSAFDLAMLKISTDGLRPVAWTKSFSPTVGTFLAAAGPQELPLAAGVVSVARRDLADAAPPKLRLPLREPCAPLELLMMESGRADPKGGYLVYKSLCRALAGGVRAGDLLQTVDGQPVRNHREMTACLKGHLSGDWVTLELTRAGKPVTVKLRLHAGGNVNINFRMRNNFRSDDFPTVFEHALPVLPNECGGPLVDLSGKVVGITIARVGTHGCMAIPGDCVQQLLPALRSGRLDGNWVDRPSGKKEH